jgi:hypothetical protein
MKTRTNISVDPELWHQFRVECLARHTSASREIEAFVKTRLQQWDKKGGKQKK